MSGGVAELRFPVRAVAERLVLRGAAAAQRVVLEGRAVPEPDTQQLDSAGHRVRAAVGHGHRRLATRRLGLGPFDRIAQRPGRTFPDRRDDLLDLLAVGVYPGLLAHAEHRGE